MKPRLHLPMRAGFSHGLGLDYHKFVSIRCGRRFSPEASGTFPFKDCLSCPVCALLGC